MPEETTSVSQETAGRREIDAVDLLLAQHREVRALFKQLKAAQGKDSKALVKEVSDKLIIHAQLEEQIFYPAMRKIDPGQIRHSLEEHQEAEEILSSLSDLSYLSPGFDEKVAALIESVEHHVEEEEETVLPEARRQLRNLDELGEEMLDLQGKIDPGHIRNEWQKSGGVH